MHQFRSKSPIIWIRISALFFCLVFVAGGVLVAFTVQAIIRHTHDAMMHLLYSIGGFVFCWFFYLYASLMCKCPLCRSSPMSSKSCSKHRNAGTTLGSYRLRVATSVLFLNRFRCPYCGESTRCRVKSAQSEQNYS